MISQEKIDALEKARQEKRFSKEWMTLTDEEKKSWWTDTEAGKDLSKELREAQKTAAEAMNKLMQPSPLRCRCCGRIHL